MEKRSGKQVKGRKDVGLGIGDWGRELGGERGRKGAGGCVAEDRDGAWRLNGIMICNPTPGWFSILAQQRWRVLRASNRSALLELRGHGFPCWLSELRGFSVFIFHED